MGFLRFLLVPFTCLLSLLTGYGFIYFIIKVSMIIFYWDFIWFITGGTVSLVIVAAVFYMLPILFTLKLMEFYKFKYIVAILHTFFISIGNLIGFYYGSKLIPDISILWEQSWIKTILLIVVFIIVFLKSISGALEPMVFSKKLNAIN